VRYESGRQVESGAVRSGHVAHPAETGWQRPASRTHSRHGAAVTQI